MYPNSLQIFHFCGIHENERKKPGCRTLFEVNGHKITIWKC
jgi:hypothetical protein